MSEEFGRPDQDTAIGPAQSVFLTCGIDPEGDCDAVLADLRAVDDERDTMVCLERYPARLNCPLSGRQSDCDETS